MKQKQTFLISIISVAIATSIVTLFLADFIYVLVISVILAFLIYNFLGNKFEVVNENKDDSLKIELEKANNLIKELKDKNMKLDDELTSCKNDYKFMKNEFDIEKIINESNNQVLDLVNNTVEHVKTASDNIILASKNNYANVENIINQIHNMHTHFEQLSAEIEEVTQSASMNAFKIQETSDKTKHLKELILSNNDYLNNLSGAMKEVAQVSDNAQVKVNQLTKKMDEIANIATIIDEIADQTNLLALNAAIEAARAGEQGRGFAVVADEVRKLAERTTKATKEISTTISALQKDVNSVSNEMDVVKGKIDKELEIIQTLWDSLENVSKYVNELNDMTNYLSASSVESAQTHRDMSNKLIEQIQLSDNINKETTTIKSSSEELEKTTLKVFLNLAKFDHIKWVDTVCKMTLKGNPENKIMTDHFNCKFGKWYYSYGVSQFANNNIFKELEKIHIRVHQLGNEEMLKRAAMLSVEEREQKCKELKQLRDTVVDTLERLINSF
jgi:methyl-accepting chemotaxis protein